MGEHQLDKEENLVMAEEIRRVWNSQSQLGTAQ